jgi:polyketide biosynthesis enoyl-CoA hydratase PksI
VALNASHVTFEREGDGVSLVTMRDASSQNAMSPAFVHDLVDVLREAARQPEARVIVLAGLPEIFSSGASLETLRQLVRGDAEPTDIVLPKVMLELPIPVIAAMEGHAIGGGFALGCSADMVLIAKESRYGLPFTSLGFTPGMGTTELLSHVLSPALVSELIYGGEPKKGSFFEGKSGFNAIAPRAKVRELALDLAARVAERPRPVLELTKRALTLGRRSAFERTITIESLMHRVSFRDAADQILRSEELVQVPMSKPTEGQCDAK